MAKHRLEYRLRDGSRIVVVGGGPAGSFFAWRAQQLAREQGLNVSVTICDGKNFARQGPLGCNMCAGVIAAPLGEHLAAVGLTLPEGRVQHRVEGYYFQTPSGGFALDHPDGKRAIRTVFRGNGPRFAQQAGNVSFDDFLLENVRDAGATLVPYPVHDIVLPKRAGEPAAVICGDHRATQTIEADLVVGAFGLNTVLLDKVRRLGFGYQPPRSQRVCQAELPLGRQWIEQRLGNRIVVLTVVVGAARLGILTPKGDHVTLTLLGKGDVGTEDLKTFLALPAVQSWLPSGWSLPDNFCHCFPRLASNAARRPYADRLVLIGDASCSRYYKNGIESALATAALAAETAFRLGVAASDFERGYARRVRELIVNDNHYGRLLCRLPGVLSRFPLLAEAQHRVVTSPRGGAVSRKLRRALWHVLTGDIPYRSILLEICDLRLILRLATTMTLILSERWLTRFKVLGLAIWPLNRPGPA